MEQPGIGFEMHVEERIAPVGIPDVVLAGPVVRGNCRTGDRLKLVGPGVELHAVCLGIELVNWGRSRSDWVSLRISDVDLTDVEHVHRVFDNGLP